MRSIGVLVLALAMSIEARSQTPDRRPTRRDGGSFTRSSVTGPAGQVQQAVAGGATMTLTLQPMTSYPGGAYNTGSFYDSSDISGTELTLSGGPGRVYINLFLADWDLEGDGPYIREWEVRVDSAGYASGVGAPLVKAVEPCGNAAECTMDFGESSVPCSGGFCTFAWVKKNRTDGIQTTAPPSPCATNIWEVVNLTSPDGHTYFGAMDQEDLGAGVHCGRGDIGEPRYGGSFALDVPAGAAGVYTIGMNPDLSSFIDDSAPSANDIPIAAFIPAVVNIAAGSCCTNITPNGATCTDNVSQTTCMSLPSSNGHVFRLRQSCPASGGPACGTCTPGPVGDAFCSDGDDCTDDTCAGGTCLYTLNYDPDSQCCDPTTGQMRLIPPDGPCISYECAANGQLVSTSQPVGAACDPGDPCLTNTTCDSIGRCLGQESAGPACRKSRYISLTPFSEGEVTAIRVTLTSLHHPMPPYNPGINWKDYTAYEGEYRYVGPVSNCIDSASFNTTFKCAKLQCMPEYVDWEAVLQREPLHVTGSAVVPSSSYDVDLLPIECQGMEDTCGVLFPQAPVFTSRWGDVTAPYQNEGAANPNQPNTLDIHAVLDKLKNTFNKHLKPRVQLNGNDPDPMPLITAQDLGRAVDAVKGLGYQLSGPEPCSP